MSTGGPSQVVKSKNLPCGGKLEISAVSWNIQYYFRGPDLRYNGTFVSIPGSQVGDYISAFGDNWMEYVTLRETIPPNGEFSKAGRCGMTIRVGRFAQGVCLRNYHLPIFDEKKLIAIQDSYRYAINRAAEVQAMLRNLGS